MAHLAEPPMTKGGTLLTMSYNGSQRVVENCRDALKRTTQTGIVWAASRSAANLAGLTRPIRSDVRRRPDDAHNSRHDPQIVPAVNHCIALSTPPC
jgi:hypothetical protein